MENNSVIFDKNRLTEINRIMQDREVKNLLYSGESDTIAYVIYNSIQNGYITPTISEPETVINATIMSNLNIGIDVGQIEYLEKYALDKLERAQKKEMKKIQLKETKSKYLHEEIEEKLCNVSQ